MVAQKAFLTTLEGAEARGSPIPLLVCHRDGIIFHLVDNSGGFLSSFNLVNRGGEEM